MSEKPILFSTEMVQAILDDRKTVTRRVIKPQPDEVARESIPDWSGDLHQVKAEDPDGNRLFGFCTSPDLAEGDYYGVMKSPYGQPGDLLYVRETWQVTDFLHPSDENYGYIYKASENGRDWEENADSWRWEPSIFMPKAASRIWLTVTDVRVERVQDISDEDIIAEGFQHFTNADYRNFDGTTYISWWKELWDSINAKRGYGWDTNPWVWVVEFEVLSTTGKPKTTLQGVTEE